MDPLLELTLTGIVEVIAGILDLILEAVLPGLRGSKDSKFTFVSVVLMSIGSAIIISYASLFFFPSALINNMYLSGVVLIFLPLLNGFICSKLGPILEKKFEPRPVYEHFLPAFFFALTFNLVRLHGVI